MAKSFKIPFAFTGDKTTVPVALQPDGSVSYTQGFGPDYELDKLVDPINAKDVPRDQTNQLFFDVTESLGEVQQYGAALWSADMAPYPINALVRHSDIVWRNTVAGNSAEPGTDATWANETIDYLNTQRIDVASASTVDLTALAPDTRHINITGTTAITGFTVAAGQCYFVRFAGALTLTNSASLVTQTGVNITTAAGDTCVIRATAASTVEILMFVRGAVSQSKSANGYRVLHDGSANPVIIQWGTCTFNASGIATVSFPIAFPNNAFSITANADTTNSLSFVETVSYQSLTTTGVTLSSGSGASVAGGTGRYMVIGN